jgi:amidophosphoribosyltransferase
VARRRGDRHDGARGRCPECISRGQPAGALSQCYGITCPISTSCRDRPPGRVAREIGADLLIYQDLEALKEAVRGINPKLVDFEASCFDGKYITGDITADYLSHLAVERGEARGQAEVDLLEEEKQPG